MKETDWHVHTLIVKLFHILLKLIIHTIQDFFAGESEVDGSPQKCNRWNIATKIASVIYLELQKVGLRIYCRLYFSLFLSNTSIFQAMEVSRTNFLSLHIILLSDVYSFLWKTEDDSKQEADETFRVIRRWCYSSADNCTHNTWHKVCIVCTKRVLKYVITSTTFTKNTNAKLTIWYCENHFILWWLWSLLTTTTLCCPVHL